MRADPIRQLLAPRRLGVRKARRAQGGDEYLDRDDLAGTGVDYLGGAPGEIDEELLAGDMDLAHRRLQSAGPAPVQIDPNAFPRKILQLDLFAARGEDEEGEA